MQDNWPSVLFAMAGGVVLSLGNLSTQYAWAFVGLSVTEVITASITVVIGALLTYQYRTHTSATLLNKQQFFFFISPILKKIFPSACSSTESYCIIFVLIVTGTTLNYFLDDKINKAEILFPGVGCFLVAVCLGSAVHSSNTADNEAKLNYLSSDYKDGAVYVLYNLPTVILRNDNWV